MRSWVRRILLLVIFSPYIAFSQVKATPPVTQAQPAAADAYRNESLVFERYETTIRMHSDGTGERLVHVVLRIQSEAAARQFGVLSFDYASASETPKIVLVRVHKPDGSTVDTPASDAIDMAAPVTHEAPLYSDLKEKHLPVRALAAGDTLEYELDTTIDKPEAPGQFWGATHFTVPGTTIVLAEVLNLEVPLDKYVQVWSPNHKPVITDHDGIRSYHWDVPQLITAPRNTDQSGNSTKPTPPKDPDEDADGGKLPSVAWTTFHSWAEVGDWYRGLALERAQPNDVIRARADELTKDAKTPEAQARALYAFVSLNIRYVGIDFGVGRYQPHSASDVLANGYGDCKDKDTLLEALLRAKGFQTAPVLIGVGIVPVSEVPTPAVFNHVITTVDMPGGRIWLDSTAEVAPYQLLSATIRDQKALVVPTAGPASLEKTPAAAPYPFIEHFDADGVLTADGKFTAHVTATYRSDDEILLRALARGVAPAEWDKASQYFSSITGFGGTTSNTSFRNTEDFSSPAVLTYDYARHPYGDWDDRRIVPAMPALEFLPLDNTESAPTEDIQLGAPRTLIATSRILLPEGYRTDLPDPVHVKTDFATVDKIYRFDGKAIVVERTIVVLKKKLPKAEWKRYEEFTKNIHLDGEPWIQLIEPPKALSIHVIPPAGWQKAADKASGSTAGTTANLQSPAASPSQAVLTPPPDDAPAEDQISWAFKQMQSKDMDGATATLDKVKAKNPDQVVLWAAYGLIAEDRKHYDEAKADFNKELLKQPNNPGIVGALSRIENEGGDAVGARLVLEDYLKRVPGDIGLSRYLSMLQTDAGDNEGALKTLQTAAEQNPGNSDLGIGISEALQRLGRDDEAAASAKSVLEGSDDPEVLNDAGYVLAETGIDLPYAEESSRKSIQTLEDKSASITTAEVNSKAFAQSYLLTASWDTLGWILFREGKTEEALPLVLAGWRNALEAEGGDHLGQIYEAMGKTKEALAAYCLAHEAIHGDTLDPAIRKHISDSLARLSASDKKNWVCTGTQGLQDSRTYKIPRPPDVSGWGTFRLQISASGVVESQQMSGEEKLAKIATSIQAMKFPELVPPGSKADLLRSAVVSCSMGSTCELVLVPRGNLNTEGQSSQ